MATEKLLKAVISGPAERLDDALRTLVLDKPFHPLNASEALRALGPFGRFEEPDPYAPALDAAQTLMSRLGVAPAFREYDGFDFALKDTEAYLKAAGASCSRITTHKTAEESLASDDAELLGRFAPFSELEVDIADLLAVKRLTLRFGSAESAEVGEMEKYADASPDVMLFRAGADGERVSLLVLSLPDKADRALEELSNLGFELRDTPDGAGMTGVPKKRVAELTAEIAAARDKAAQLAEELKKLGERERDELLARRCWLKFNSSAHALRSYAGEKDGKFYLAGWLSADASGEWRDAAAALGLEAELAKPGVADFARAPVKFTGGFFSRIFAPFVEMYGYPAYGEIDPRLFMLVTYSLLFGIMFGDIGQGALLCLFGVFLAKKKGKWLGRILASVGVMSVVFGFIYGSVFGNEHLLPGFKVLEGGNLMTALIITVGVGALMIIACGVLNVITGLRQRDFKKAIFSANGVAGLVFYISLVLAAALTFISGVNLFGSTAFIICCLCVPAACLFFAEPLSKLCAGEKDWLPHSVGMLIIEGFFDIFESCLSWFSNTVSFLRVGAYAVCHAGMMMVVYLLSANSSGGYAIWGLVLGNAIVMVIEALLVCIQVLRLQYYELFGRFYSGRGTPFVSPTVDYAH